MCSGLPSLQFALSIVVLTLEKILFVKLRFLDRVIIGDLDLVASNQM